jgi:hypothetical protein
MSVQTFFYSGQIRRFVTQFIRIVSGFQVQYGRDANGAVTLQRVPVYYGGSSRQVAQIIMGNSENTLQSVPAMTVYISELKYDRNRVQEPNHVEKLQLRQRYFNPDTQAYEAPLQGGAYTIERLMPVPYTLTLKLDAWTSSTDQKLQLLEQLTILFNPSMEIQNTDNYVDWSSLSAVTLEDINWSSRSIPSGTEDAIDVASLTFSLPIWISPPAKVTKMGVIQKIISSVFDSNGDLEDTLSNDANLLGTRQYFTPLNYDLLYVGNELTLLRIEDMVSEPNDNTEVPEKVGTPEKWVNLINLYGKLVPGISQIRLIMQSGNEIVGTVAYHPTDDTKLLFSPDVDTLPANTLTAIDAVIDPERVTVDSNILSPAIGTRYLILNPIGDTEDAAATKGPKAWSGQSNLYPLVAEANDIIQYDGTKWFVDFASTSHEDIEYVTNLTTSIQYKWQNNQWTKSYVGQYTGGNWTIVI